MSSITSSAVSAVRSIIYLGMDVHKESITIAVLPMEAKSPIRLERLPNDLPKLRKWLERVGRDGEIRACYEASGAGYVIHRAMKGWGFECEVIAPSLIQKRPGVQRKHDKRDAADLARFYRAGSSPQCEYRARLMNEYGMLCGAAKRSRRRFSSRATTY